MRKTFLNILFLLPVSICLAQPGDWSKKSVNEKMKLITDAKSILLKSEDNDLKAEKLMELTVNYLLHETNDTILTTTEDLVIGISYFSGQYFYHSYESMFQEFFVSNEEILLRNSRIKTAKIIFALSCGYNEIELDSYNKAKEILEPGDIAPLDCKNLQDAATILKNKLGRSELFIQLLNSCPDNVDLIFKVRLGLLLN